MIGEKRSPKIEQNESANNTRVIGTQTLEGRGWYYDYVIISPNCDLVFGSEEGNYAGGVTLSPTFPNQQDYQKKKEEKLKWIKSSDPTFYDLIQKTLATYKTQQ